MLMVAPAHPTTLITDFDNTLYDWFHMWHQSFAAMLCEVERISGISKSILLPQIRQIHQKYHTSEYAFLLEELPCLREAYPAQDILVVFDEAIHAYRRARKSSLQLYEGVQQTLGELRASGVLIVIYTESLGYYTNSRIRRLELDELVDFVYSPPDHDVPIAAAHYQNSSPDSDGTKLVHVKHSYIPKGVTKPNPEVLLDIVKDVDRSPGECLYLGDSLMKDVAMAQDAGIIDVFADYGGVQHRDEYNLLRQVSHWTDADVEREQATSRRTVTPSHSISHFSEIKQFFGG
jgi:phosphoglycolate phosphatase